MSKDRVRIGCDPEIFLSDAKGKIVPVTGMVGGTKSSTVPLLSLLHGGLPDSSTVHYKKFFKSPEFGILEDGPCLEFNVPSSSEWDRFCSNVTQVVCLIESWAHNKGLKLALGTPEAEFSEETFEKNSVLKDIGCSPDFDAYGDCRSRKPITHADLGTKRFSGGHIHLGYNTEMVPPYIMAKFMDLIVGLPLVILGEKQGGRRAVYGQAGLYRPKPYGVEYRTPSNLWVKHTGTNAVMYLTSAILSLGRMADTMVPMLKGACAPGVIPWVEVRRAINNEDRNLAIDVFAYIQRQFPDLMNASAGAIKGNAPIWDPEYKATPKSKKEAALEAYYEPALQLPPLEIRRMDAADRVVINRR